MSSFSSLNTALSGLLAHRKSIDTIGHNIANSATEGFSRRRVELSPVGSWTVPSMFSRPGAQVGNGVGVTDITRIRDEFLETRALREHGIDARLGVEATALGRLEVAVPEPSDVGLAAQLGDFYAAWDDVANNPGDSAGRIAVLQQASTVASTLNRVSADMRAMRDSAVDEATVLVAEVNSTAARVAELNHAISQATAAGMSPHDLADERDRLVMSLGDLIGVETRAGANGSVTVTLGGTALVSGSKAELLQVAEPGPLTGPFAGTGLDRVQVQWARDGYPAAVTNGEVGGLLTNANEHIPHALSDLDVVAATLVSTVNAVHVTGLGLDPADVNLNF
ncbi:MAG: flagellar hook-associated protein FlgK, partial [Microthrixaceae bacterium]